LTVFNHRNLNDKMPKSGPKPKVITQPRWNPYKHRLGPFLGDSEAFLRTAKARGPDCDTIDDDIAIDDTRRRSWTREQKLGAIKYALSKVVLNKAGKEEPISNNAAATNIGCTPKMLRDWIRDYDTINASAKGCQKSRLKASAKEPQMEQELHELFLQKRAIRRKIGARWFFRNAQLIYGQIYPQRVVRAEGKHTTYTGFGFSRGWFEGFIKRKNISLRVSLFSI
jgi:transposase-like protein